MIRKLLKKNEYKEELSAKYNKMKNELIVLTRLKDFTIILHNSEEGLANKAINKIWMPKKVSKYNENQLRFIMSHEMAHIEFKETTTTIEHIFLKAKENRLKNIINEVMADIRGFRISGIDLDDIDSYFKIVNNNQTANGLYKFGYFLPDVRNSFVIYSTKSEFTKEGFRRKFICEYNRISNAKSLNEKELDRLLDYYFDEFGI